MHEILIRAKGRNKVGGLVVPHHACFFCFLIGCGLCVRLPLEVQNGQHFLVYRLVEPSFTIYFSRGEKHHPKGSPPLKQK